jgi:hypothetical protein
MKWKRLLSCPVVMLLVCFCSGAQYEIDTTLDPPQIPPNPKPPAFAIGETQELDTDGDRPNNKKARVLFESLNGGTWFQQESKEKDGAGTEWDFTMDPDDDHGGNWPTFTADVGQSWIYRVSLFKPKTGGGFEFVEDRRGLVQNTQ